MPARSTAINGGGCPHRWSFIILTGRMVRLSIRAGLTGAARGAGATRVCSQSSREARPLFWRATCRSGF